MPRRKKSPVVETQETFDDNVSSKMTGSSSKRDTHYSKVSAFKSYIVDEEQYNLYKLYKSYYKSKNDENKVAGFHAGAVIFRTMNDFERRCSFYLNTTKHTTKKELKKSICQDLDLLKEIIMGM
jgi:hypothetical protein